jgi:hypothetical protein
MSVIVCSHLLLKIRVLEISNSLHELHTHEYLSITSLFNKWQCFWQPTTPQLTTRGMFPPDTEGSHHVPHGPTVDRGASPGSPRNSHIFQGGSASICSRACVLRTLKDPRRATNSECQPSGSSASHHQALPTHGPPQTSSGSSPRLPSYIRAQGPREVHPRLPPSGHNAPDLGAPTQRPLPGPVMER